MTILKIISIVCTVLGLAVGGWAAKLWWQSSQIECVPYWVTYGGIEPVDPHQSQQDWLIGLLHASKQSGQLNKSASLFSAISLLLSTCGSVLSTI